MGFDLAFHLADHRLIVLAMVVLLAGSTALAAEATRETSTTPSDSIVTDRPTDSASPELVPRATLQFELGYKFSRLDTDAGRTDTQ